MTPAYLGLGSNLGDRRAHLREAVRALSEVATVVEVSSVYETEPVGGPSGQPPYLNAVVALETSMTPRELLDLARSLEDAAGRVRTERWGPRTLDVDVLLVGEETVTEPDLEVPHPRMWERRFVTEPLHELDPQLRARPDGSEGAAGGEVRRIGKL